MHTIEIPQKNIKVELPSSWDECTTDQGAFIIQEAFKVINGQLAIAEFRIRVFLHLSDMRLGWKYLLRNKLGLNKVNNERIFQLSEQLCNWVFSKNENDSYELNFKTVTNFFPLLLDRYHGPESLLADLTLGEFKSALAVLNQYFEYKDNEEEAMPYLDFFIATIYRPLDATNKKLSLHNYAPDPEAFGTVPLWQKQSIAIWFSFCIKCLQEKDLVINGIEVNFSCLFPKYVGPGRNHQKTNLGWTGVLMDIAEAGVFGDAVSTAQTPLYDILLFLLKKSEDKPQEK